MAPLQIIGAGFGRTGTDSLRTALNTLGYTTYHMRECIANELEGHGELFSEAYDDPENFDFDRIYKNYDACLDWPSVTFLKHLITKYPDAKVILTIRDPDAWYKSCSKTIFTMYKDMPKRILEMNEKVVLHGHLKGNLEDEEFIKQTYLDHIEWVKANVPDDKLLVYEAGEGWDRLCAFLGKQVPKISYPHVNSTASVEKRAAQAKIEGRPFHVLA